MSLRLWNATTNMEKVASAFDYAPKTEQDWSALQRAYIRLQLALLMENGASLSAVAPFVQKTYGGEEGLARIKAIFGGLCDAA